MNNKKPIEEILHSGKAVNIETVNYYGNKIITKAIVQEMNAQGLVLNLQKQEGIFNQVSTNAEVKIVCCEECNAGTTGYFTESEFIFTTKFIKVREDAGPPQLVLSVPVLSSGGGNDGNHRQDSRALPFSYFVEDKEIKEGTVKDLTAAGLVAFVKADRSLEVGLGLPFKLSLPTSSVPLLIIGTITGLNRESDYWQVTLDFSHIPRDVQDQITKYLFSLPKPAIKREPKQKTSFIKIK